MDLEQRFNETDFSGLSKVRESLFDQLIERRAEKIELDAEELEFLAAAGNGNPSKISKRVPKGRR